MTEKNESGHEKSEHSWKKPEDQAREVAPPTHEAHQWYIRSYVPAGVLSLGINGPENGSDKTLKGIFGATAEDIGFMAEKNIHEQAGEEMTIDVGTEYIVQANEEIVMTTPGKFEVVTGKLVEITAIGAVPGKTLGTNPYEPLLGEEEEDSGVESVHEVHEAREENKKAREEAIEKMEAMEHGHHNTMATAGGIFAGVELLMGTYFGSKAKGAMGKTMGIVGALGGFALFITKVATTKKDQPGTLKINAKKDVAIWGGERVEILAGQYVTVEAVYRVFIESAGMASIGAPVVSVFGAIAAELLGGVNAGLLAGRQAEVAARQDVIVESHKGGLFLETKGSSQAVFMAAEKSGSTVFGAANKHVQFEAHHGVHLESKADLHATAHKVVAIHSEGSGDKALAIAAEEGMVTVAGKNVTVRGENSVKLIVEGGGSIEINKSGVTIYDSSTSHKFMSGQLKSVVPGSVRVPKPAFRDEIKRLDEEMEKEAKRVLQLVGVKETKKASKV